MNSLYKREKERDNTMIEITLWITMLMNQWIPGPVLIPHPTVYAPKRILRCVECGTWPVRIRQ